MATKKTTKKAEPGKKAGNSAPVILSEHIVEIISDSGEGAQRWGQSLGSIAARMGNGIWTTEIIPAEIRPPARSVAGALARTGRVARANALRLRCYARVSVDNENRRERRGMGEGNAAFYGPAPQCRIVVTRQQCLGFTGQVRGLNHQLTPLLACFPPALITGAVTKAEEDRKRQS